MPGTWELAMFVRVLGILSFSIAAVVLFVYGVVIFAKPEPHSPTHAEYEQYDEEKVFGCGAIMFALVLLGIAGFFLT